MKSFQSLMKQTPMMVDHCTQNRLTEMRKALMMVSGKLCDLFKNVTRVEKHGASAILLEELVRREYHMTQYCTLEFSPGSQKKSL